MHEILHKKPEIKPVATFSSAAELQTDGKFPRYCSD